MVNSVKEVDNLSNILYNSIDKEERKDAEAKLKDIAEDIGTLLHVLDDSSSVYSHMFATLSLVPSFKKQQSSLRSNVSNLINRLINRIISASHRGTVIARITTRILQCISQITKLEFAHYACDATHCSVAITRALAVLSGNLNPQVDIPLDSSEIGEGPVNMMFSLLTHIVNEFNFYDSKRNQTYMNFLLHRRASHAIRDEFLLDILYSAVKYLSTSSSTTRVASLKLIKAVLTYDFQAILLDETEETLITHFPLAWKETILSDALALLWASHTQLPPPECTIVLQALQGLMSCRRSILDDDKTLFLERCISQHILAEKCGDSRFANAEYCSVYADTLNHMTPAFAYRDLVACVSFNQWINIIACFTLSNFKIQYGEEGSFHTTCTILSFWNRMINSKKSYHAGAALIYSDESKKDETIDIEQYFPTLVSTFLYSRLSPNTNLEATQDQDSIEILIAQSMHFHAFFIASPNECLLALIQSVEYIGTQSIASNPSSYTWFMHILSQIIQQVLIHSFSKHYSVSVSILKLAIQCIQLKHSAMSSTSEQEEVAILQFLKVVQNVFCVAYASEVTKKMRDEVFGNHAGVFQFILTMVGHHMVQTSTSVTHVVNDAIVLIAEAARYAPEEAKKTLVFNIPPIVNLPLSQSRDTYKLRTQLYFALYSLKSCNFSHQTFINFMSPIEELMKASEQGLEGALEPLFIGGWLRDLGGVVKAVADETHEFVLLIDWVVERKEFFLALSKLPQADPIIISSLLRFIELIVTPSFNDTLKIPSSSYSPCGLILFKFIAEVIETLAINNVTPDKISAIQAQLAQSVASESTGLNTHLYGSVVKPLIMCSSIIRLCLMAQICPFGIMAYYNDNTFDKLIVGLLQLWSAFPVQLFLQYKNASEFFTLLLKCLIEGQLLAPFTLISTGDIESIIYICLHLVSDTETKSPTLLNALHLIECVAELYKSSMELKANTPQGVSQTAIKSKLAVTLSKCNPNIWWNILMQSMTVLLSQDRYSSTLSTIVHSLVRDNPSCSLWSEYKAELCKQYPDKKKHQVVKYIEQFEEKFDTATFSDGLSEFKYQMKDL